MKSLGQRLRASYYRHLFELSFCRRRELFSHIITIRSQILRRWLQASTYLGLAGGTQGSFQAVYRMDSVPNEAKDWLSLPNILLFGGSTGREPYLVTLDNFYDQQPMAIEVPYSESKLSFKTVEHYFQSAKFFGYNHEWAEQVRLASDGKQAQLRGREMRLPRERLDRWKATESTKAMRRALRAKFLEPPRESEIASALWRTENATLVEKVEECVLPSQMMQHAVHLDLTVCHSDPTWDDTLVRLHPMVCVGHGAVANECECSGLAQWGVGQKGIGLNRMGVLLMEVRDELQKS